MTLLTEMQMVTGTAALRQLLTTNTVNCNQNYLPRVAGGNDEDEYMIAADLTLYSNPLNSALRLTPSASKAAAKHGASSAKDKGKHVYLVAKEKY